MRRLRSLRLGLACLALGLAGAPALADDIAMPVEAHRLVIYPEIADSPYAFETSPADDWTALFHRQSGWTGADGIYSVPMNGHQAPGRASRTRTLFTFADTVIGEVDPETGRRKPGYEIVNASVAVLRGAEPRPSRIRFEWPGRRGWPVFRIQVPPLKGMRFWLQDGWIRSGNYYSLALAVKQLDSGHPWWARGTVLMGAPVDPHGPIWMRSRQRLGVYEHRDDEDALVFFGAALLENTERAGWANPDGWLYVYGRYERAMRPYNPWKLRVELMVARVRPEDFKRYERWQFWNGEAWSPRIGDAAPVGLGGPELSVTPIECGVLAGKYLLISKQVRSDIYYRVGDRPWGPFSVPYRLHSTVEEERYGYPTFTYNAKAHPHLSQPGRLLVSYNVHNLEALGDNADIYRPRFIWLNYGSEAECSGAE